MRTAVVTGTGQGFGAALAAALVGRGWTVIAVSRSPHPTPAGVAVVVGDVTDEATATAVGAELDGRPLDLLVNNAGRSGGARTLDDIDAGDLRVSFATNVEAPIWLTRALAANLVAARGLVVNVSSRLASLSRQAVDHYDQGERRTSYGYRITKAAQNMLTVALAAELGPRGVATWALHPGRLRTRLGSASADTSPADAAARFVTLVDRRDVDDVLPRFVTLDPRESADGQLPW